MSSEQNLNPEKMASLLLDGETLTIPTGLQNKDKYPVTLECSILPSQSERKWILVTAIANDTDVGFIDARYIPDTGYGAIESPHHRRSGIYPAPHDDIRFSAGDDGFFVVEDERNNGIGSKIFLQAIQILTGLGADKIHVNQPSEKSKSFYKKHGGQEVLGGYFWDLSLPKIISE